MRKKLTITIDEDVYTSLHKVVGERKISDFIESLVRPHVIRDDRHQSIVELLAMPEAADIDFDPPRVKIVNPWLKAESNQVASQVTQLQNG